MVLYIGAIQVKNTKPQYSVLQISIKHFLPWPLIQSGGVEGGGDRDKERKKSILTIHRLTYWGPKWFPISNKTQTTSIWLSHFVTLVKKKEELQKVFKKFMLYLLKNNTTATTYFFHNYSAIRSHICIWLLLRFTLSLAYGHSIHHPLVQLFWPSHIIFFLFSLLFWKYNTL